MATLFERQESMILSVDSLYDQVDVVRLYLNPPYDINNIPEKLKRDKVELYTGPDLGAAGKFLKISNPDEVYLTVDDDFKYPIGYAKEITRYLNMFKGLASVSFHGTTFLNIPIKSYKSGHIYYRCMKDVFGIYEIDLLGTGVGGCVTNTMQMTLDDFIVGNASDVDYAAQCKKHDIKMYALPHKGGYISYIKPKGYNIYNRIYNDMENRLCQIINYRLFNSGTMIENLEGFKPLKDIDKNQIVRIQ